MKDGKDDCTHARQWLAGGAAPLRRKYPNCPYIGLCNTTQADTKSSNTPYKPPISIETTIAHSKCSFPTDHSDIKSTLPSSQEAFIEFAQIDWHVSSLSATGQADQDERWEGCWSRAPPKWWISVSRGQQTINRMTSKARARLRSRRIITDRYKCSIPSHECLHLYVSGLRCKSKRSREFITDHHSGGWGINKGAVTQKSHDSNECSCSKH